MGWKGSVMLDAATVVVRRAVGCAKVTSGKGGFAAFSSHSVSSIVKSHVLF